MVKEQARPFSLRFPLALFLCLGLLGQAGVCRNTPADLDTGGRGLVTRSRGVV